MQDFNKLKIEETIKRGGSLRETKKLRIGRDRVHALKDNNGKVTNNTDEIVRIAEHFYAQLHDSNARLENILNRTDLVGADVPVITIDEVKKMKVMSRGTAAGEDGITVVLFKDGGDIVLKKLAN